MVGRGSSLTLLKNFTHLINVGQQNSPEVKGVNFLLSTIDSIEISEKNRICEILQLWDIRV